LGLCDEGHETRGFLEREPGYDRAAVALDRDRRRVRDGVNYLQLGLRDRRRRCGWVVRIAGAEQNDGSDPDSRFELEIHYPILPV
jgi:hypothetical protein